MSTAKVTLPLDRELTLTRTFDAPRALVFKMWTDPKHLAAWFGPKDFTNPVCEVDPHPSGRVHVVMHAPWGADYPMDGVFKRYSAGEDRLHQ
jgi:uncharacterized protein YndB with AHSA1/START domain